MIVHTKVAWGELHAIRNTHANRNASEWSGGGVALPGLGHLVGAYPRCLTKDMRIVQSAGQSRPLMFLFFKVLDSSDAPFYKWFPGGKFNTCYNALDIHVEQGLLWVQRFHLSCCIGFHRIHRALRGAGELGWTNGKWMCNSYHFGGRKRGEGPDWQHKTCCLGDPQSREQFVQPLMFLRSPKQGDIKMPSKPWG